MTSSLELVRPGSERRPAFGGVPTRSHVVLSSGPLTLRRGIGTLPARDAVIVVCSDDAADMEDVLERARPDALLVRVPRGASTLARREVGMRATAADIVAFHDDTRLDSSAEEPVCSVIVAAREAPAALDATLAALGASTLPRPRWELIVVVDAGGDATSVVAARHADRVIRLRAPRPFGSGYARNRGAELARGDILVFVDADGRPAPEALAALHAALVEDPSIAGVDGSFATAADAIGFASRYRDALQHAAVAVDAVVHAGCRAVRRDAFVAAGSYDEWHVPTRALLEHDLGHRLAERGYRLARTDAARMLPHRPTTIRELVAAEAHRATLARVNVPPPPCATVTLSPLATAGVVGAMVGAVMLPHAAWIAAVVPCALLGRARPGAPRVGPIDAVGAITVDAVRRVVAGAAHVGGVLLRGLVGEPKPDATTEAFAEVGVRTWPPIPVRRQSGALAR